MEYRMLQTGKGTVTLPRMGHHGPPLHTCRMPRTGSDPTFLQENYNEIIQPDKVNSNQDNPPDNTKDSDCILFNPASQLSTGSVPHPEVSETSVSRNSPRHLQRLKEAFSKSRAFIKDKVVSYRQKFKTSGRASEQTEGHSQGSCSEGSQQRSPHSEDNNESNLDSSPCQSELTQTGDGVEKASSSDCAALEVGMDKDCKKERIKTKSNQFPAIQNLKDLFSKPKTINLNNNSIHPEDKENIPSDIPNNDVIDDLPLGTEATNINGENPIIDQRSLFSKRAKWLTLRENFANSVNSDTSQQTNTSSNSGVDVILKERQVDPEEILYNLGFSGSGDFNMETDRIPRRFFQQQSTASGIDFDCLLPQQPEISNVVPTAGPKTRGPGTLRRQASLSSVMYGMKFIMGLQGQGRHGPPSVPEENENQTVSILHPDNQKFLADQGYYDQFPDTNENFNTDHKPPSETRKSVSTEGSHRRNQFRSSKSTAWSLVESDDKTDSRSPSKLILSSFTSGDSADSSDSAPTPSLISSLWRKHASDVTSINEENNNVEKSLPKQQTIYESFDNDEVFGVEKQISNDSDSFLERETEKISSAPINEVQNLSQNSFLSVKPSGVDASSDVGSDQTFVDHSSVHTDTTYTGSGYSDSDQGSCKPNVSVIVSSNSGEHRYSVSSNTDRYVKKGVGGSGKETMYPQESFEMEEISSTDPFMEDTGPSSTHSHSGNLPRMESSTSDSSGFAEQEQQTDLLMPCELDFVKRMERLGSSGESDRTLIGNFRVSNPASPSIQEEISEAMSQQRGINPDHMYRSDKNNNDAYFSSEKTILPKSNYDNWSKPSDSDNMWKRNIQVTQTTDNVSKTTLFHYVDPSDTKRKKIPEKKKFVSQCYFHVNANENRKLQDRKMPPRQSSTNTDLSDRSASSSSVGGYSGFRMGANLNRTKESVNDYRSLPSRLAFKNSRSTRQSNSFDLLDSRYESEGQLGNYGRSVSEQDLLDPSYQSQYRFSTPDRGHYFADHRSGYYSPEYMLNVARGEYSSRNSLLDRSDGSSSGGSCYSTTKKPELQYAKLLRLVNQPGKYQMSYSGHSGIFFKPKHKTRYWKYLRKRQLLEEENRLVLGALYRYRSEIISLESSFSHQCNVADEDLSDDEREDVQEIQYLWSEIHREVNEMERLMSIRTSTVRAGNEHFAPLKSDSVNIVERMIELLKEQIYQQKMNYCRDEEEFGHMMQAASLPTLWVPPGLSPLHYSYGNLAPSGGHNLEKSFEDLRASLLGEIRSELKGKMKEQTQMKDQGSQVHEVTSKISPVHEVTSKISQPVVQRVKTKEIKCIVTETEV